MSNASVYFFGNLSGYPSAYPQDHTFEFFSEILSKMNSNSSLFIKRKDSLMHYAYVRQLDHEGRYLGICFVVNDIQFSNYEQLLQSFEWMVGYLVGDASIIGYDKDGSLVPLIDSFVELETVDHKMEYLLQYVFSNVSAIKLAPLRFDEISLGIKELLWGETTEEQFLYATAGNQLVQINKNVDNDTAGMIHQRSLLVEQRNYIESLATAKSDLINQVTQLKHEKKQIKWVIVLLLALLIGGVVAFNVHSKMSNEIAEQSNQIDTQGDRISMQNQTIDKLRTNIDQLNDERNNLQYLYDQALLKITQLEVDVQNLQDENQNLEQSKGEAEASAEYWKDQYFRK